MARLGGARDDVVPALARAWSSRWSSRSGAFTPAVRRCARGWRAKRRLAEARRAGSQAGVPAAVGGAGRRRRGAVQRARHRRDRRGREAASPLTARCMPASASAWAWAAAPADRAAARREPLAGPGQGGARATTSPTCSARSRWRRWGTAMATPARCWLGWEQGNRTRWSGRSACWSNCGDGTGRTSRCCRWRCASCATWPERCGGGPRRPLTRRRSQHLDDGLELRAHRQVEARRRRAACCRNQRLYWRSISPSSASSWKVSLTTRAICGSSLRYITP